MQRQLVNLSKQLRGKLLKQECKLVLGCSSQNEKKTLGQMDMSPFSYYLTVGKGSERPYTGDLYFVKDVGNYHCLTCDNQLFGYEHKYFPNTGMASFWGWHNNSIEILDDLEEHPVQHLSLNIIESEYKKGADDLSIQEKENNQQLYSQEKQRVQCKQCQAHLGLVFQDGPPPTFTRLSINSAAILFKPKDYQVNPLILRKQKKKHSNTYTKPKTNKYTSTFKYDPKAHP